ncbi:hypothetical protein SAMN02799631_00049 [Methylobacterium sp. 174MFSha1.1]|nr:hypothetical protein [Methylobacterium sp. 174MFSha1.1]SFU30880.1 hypothetical protein SAMN02799631_00049 [Methylobacterium sp. 174MFSha1.1]
MHQALSHDIMYFRNGTTDPGVGLDQNGHVRKVSRASVLTTS